MGNSIVRNRDTSIYYPSDWLIEGGPPMDVAGCPQPSYVDEDGADVEPLSLVYNRGTKYFGVTHMGYIVMESKNPEDVADYMREYIQEFKSWVAEHDS